MKFKVQFPHEPTPTLPLSELVIYGREADRLDRERSADWVFALALAVLRHFLGQAWVDEHLFAKGPLKPPSRRVDPFGQRRVGCQGLDLGELLFNLQDVDGFGEVHRRLVSGEIEAVTGELEAARGLRIHRESFRFVGARGRLGSDYDLEILRPSDSICVEVKTKSTAGHLNQAGILNSLKVARRQLPKDRPGLICLRVAGTATREDVFQISHLVDGAARRFFGQTQRVVGVVLLTQEYHEYKNDLFLTPLSRYIANPVARHSWSLTSNLATSATFPDNWLSFVTTLGRVKNPPTEWIEAQRKRDDEQHVVFVNTPSLDSKAEPGTL